MDQIPLKKAAEWSAFITRRNTRSGWSTMSARKDFFIGICHAPSFPRKAVVPSYEVIAFLSAWLRARTWAPSFIIAVWVFFSPWIQPGHASTLPFVTACAQKVERMRPSAVWDDWSGYVKQTRREACLIHENHIRADHILFHFIPILLASDQEGKKKAACDRTRHAKRESKSQERSQTLSNFITGKVSA